MTRAMEVQLEFAEKEYPFKPAEDGNGVSIKTGNDLFRYVFKDDERVMRLSPNMSSEEKVSLLKLYIDGLVYENLMARKEIRRSHKEKERISQEKLKF